jgi:hypothetical protein
LRACAYVGLREATVDERASHAGLFGGLETRPVIAEVVAIGAVERDGEPPFDPLDLGDVVELALAVKAAVGPVGHVARIGHLVRRDDAVRGPDLASESHGFVELAGRKRRRDGGHTNRSLAELARGDGQHERTINPARIADERRSKCPYSLGKKGDFGVDLGHVPDGVTPPSRACTSSLARML